MCQQYRIFSVWNVRDLSNFVICYIKTEETEETKGAFFKQIWNH